MQEEGGGGEIVVHFNYNILLYNLLPQHKVQKC